MKHLCMVLLAAISIPEAARGVEALKVIEVVADMTLAPVTRSANERGARAFYEFWDTGDEAKLREAIAPTFTDRTLPPGRPQGPDGPAMASRTFRAAVPDLRVTVERMVFTNDYVTTHMRFSGHFTGRFGSHRGTGQPIDFIATDLIKLQDGRITDNWHLEDNLTLLTQMGAASLAP